MKKKLTLILLALVLCLSGAVMAVGCTGSSNKEWTVNFYAADGVTEYGHETVKDGEKVSKDAVYVEEKDGYTIVWMVSGGGEYDFDQPVKGNLSLVLSYVANSVAYKVEHYTENLDGEGYTLETTENLTGLTDQAVTAADKAMEGFTFDAANANNVATGTVKGDGSLVLKKYYKRNEYTVKYVTADDEEFDTATVKFGATILKTDKAVEPANKTATSMDEFKYWSATENGAEYNFSTTVSGNVTLYAVYETVAREYNVSFASGAGLFTYRDADNGLLSGTTVLAGADLVFSIRVSNEAEGTPVVKMTTTNDEGVTSAATTLTAVEGKYTVENITADVAISVEGLSAREYTVSIAVADAPFPTEVAWAKTYGDIADVAVRITNYATDETTLQAGCISNGIATLTLTAGEYSAEFVIEKDGEYVSIGTGAVEFDVAYNKVVEGTTSIVVEDSATIGLPEIHYTNNLGDNFTITDGYITGEIVKHPGGHLRATFTDFAPGKSDFIATVSFAENGTFVESDPTFGLILDGVDAGGANVTSVWPSLNATGLRLRGVLSATDKRNMLPSGVGRMLSVDTNGYDVVTNILIRKGDAIYVFMTGSLTGGGVTPVNNKLLAVLTPEQAILEAHGVFNASNGYLGNVAALLEGEIKTVSFGYEMTNEAPAKIYGYGYSTDATVIDSYLKTLVSTVTVTVDGAAGETKTLAPGEEYATQIIAPAGKIIASITVNGAPYTFANKVNAKGEVYADLSVTAGLSGTAYNVVVSYKEGSLAALKGKVTSTAKVVTVTVDGIEVVVNDGAFEAFVVPGGTYLVRAEADGFKPSVVKVTDLSKTVEITVDGKYELTADSVTIGDVTLSGAPGVKIAEGMTSTTYVRDVDDEGNEIMKSISGKTTYRDVALFNYSGSRFVAETSVKYTVAPDGYIRIGFIVGNAEGQFGDIGQYGREWSSTRHDGWKNFPAMSALPGTNNLLGGHYIEAGEISIRLIYDNGNIQFFSKSRWMFGDDEWHLYYKGGVPLALNDYQAIPGDVVVGFFETSNKTPDCVFYNYSVTDLPEVKLPEGDGYTASIDYVNGDPVLSIKLDKYGVGGKELTAATVNGKTVSLSLDAATGTYTTPIDVDTLLKGVDVDVTVADYRARVNYGGTVTLDGAAVAGASVSLTGKDGISYVATTGDDGKWTVEVPADGYTARFTYTGAFDKEITFASGEEAKVNNVALTWGFGKAVGSSELDPSVEITYDATAENPYDSLVIYQTGWNQNIPWSQPIAPYSSWGFTLSMPDNISTNDKGLYYDQDMYMKWYVYDGAAKELGLKANGDNLGGTKVASENYFQKNAVGSNSNLKDFVSAGVIKSYDVRYVRNGATVGFFIKYPNETEWHHVSNLTVSNATEDIGFYTVSAARSAGYNVAFTYTDIYYYEGAADSKANVTVKNVDHATISVDKTTAAMDETVTVKVDSIDAGYAVANFIINGKLVSETDSFTTLEGNILTTQLMYMFAANAYTDYEIVPVVKSTNGFKAITGKLSYAYSQYETIYGAEGLGGIVVATATDGTQYGSFCNNGEYTILAPEGTYTLSAETAQFKGNTENVTVTADGAKADVVLDTNGEGFYTNVTGGGLVPTADGSLKYKYYGATQETAIADVTYTPNKQILEFGYTLTGMNNTVHYPHLGMFIKSGDGRIGRLVFNGDGETMIIMGQHDYNSRFVLQDVDNYKFFGLKCNLDSKGNPVEGVDQRYTWKADKWYNQKMPYELNVKFIWDGYTFKMYAQTGLMKSVAPNEWSLITEGYNIYDRYANSDTMAQYKDTLFELDKECQFGISCRLDTPSNHQTINSPTFSNIWFNIYDKPAA